MFTFDLKEAESFCISDSHVIIMFVVLLDNGRKIPVYYVTISSLFGVLDNIREIRDLIVNYCSSNNYAYSCLIGVSYVQ